jgi:hypothetical protein
VIHRLSPTFLFLEMSQEKPFGYSFSQEEDATQLQRKLEEVLRIPPFARPTCIVFPILPLVFSLSFDHFFVFTAIALDEDSTSDDVTMSGAPVWKPYDRPPLPIIPDELSDDKLAEIRAEIEELRKCEHSGIFIPRRIRCWNPFPILRQTPSISFYSAVCFLF